jgi:hypothetical protein
MATFSSEAVWQNKKEGKIKSGILLNFEKAPLLM